ncbi:MAG: IS256 family transposase [Actinobacteria bacterium]|nr:IS256 family transposase [Actinomycetota bacterium]
MANTNMDWHEWLCKQVVEADVDLLREMVATMAEMLMSAEVSAICGADYRERTDERVNSRNGSRHRPWDTRVGTIDLAIPKLREGSYFPSWLLEPRRRAEQALINVIADCYLAGVSTRRVDKLVKALGIEGISKSQVSRMAKSLDEMVEAFRNRPLTSGPYTYLWLDALTQKVREGGRVVNISCVVAIAVNSDGHREVLGCDFVTTEDGAGWTAFLRGLVARGLSGVRLVVSDAHSGLVDAVASCLPGAVWQRCRTHFARNLLCKVPKASQDLVATALRSIFAQPDAKSVYRQHAAVVEQLYAHFPEAAEMLDGARADILAFAACPKAHWRQIWSNNPLERLNREIRRRTEVVGIFPNRQAIVRLVGAVLSEQDDEWQVARRYMSLETLAKARINVIEGDVTDAEKEVRELVPAAV